MRVFLAAFLLAAGALLAQASADEQYDSCVEKGQTSLDYRECGNAWIERADADLNAAWRELRAGSSEDTARSLLDEQRAWNAFKEKSCLFWASGEYGSIGTSLSYPSCRAEIIEQRTAQLRAYLEALAEQ